MKAARAFFHNSFDAGLSLRASEKKMLIEENGASS
jgi:hypothetical protein